MLVPGDMVPFCFFLVDTGGRLAMGVSFLVERVCPELDLLVFWLDSYLPFDVTIQRLQSCRINDLILEAALPFAVIGCLQHGSSISSSVRSE